MSEYPERVPTLLQCIVQLVEQLSHLVTITHRRDQLIQQGCPTSTLQTRPNL